MRENRKESASFLIGFYQEGENIRGFCCMEGDM